MHLTNFLEVCDTIKYNGVTEEALRLRFFPLSLGDRAKHWLTSQPPEQAQGPRMIPSNNMPSNRTSEPPPEKKVDLEQALAQMLTSHSAFMNETKENMQQQATQLNNQATQLRSLNVQMGKMENLLTESQLGSLPSNSEVNPRRDGNEHVKAVMLRSGKELETKGKSPVIEEVKAEKII